MSFKAISIIGTGLIGGSIAWDIKNYDDNIEILGCNREEQIGSPFKAFTNLQIAVEAADLIILATPLSGYQEIIPHLPQDKLIIDVGSCKDLHIDLPNFVPCHPIAGSEKSGFSAASAGLFKGKRVIITPETITSLKSIKIAKEFWTKICGVGDIIEMPAKKHDEIFARISHFPQKLMFAFADVLKSRNIPIPQDQEFFRLCFSNCEMWMDIFEFNKDNINAASEIFFKEWSKDYPPLYTEDILTIHQQRNVARILRSIFHEEREYAGSGLKGILSVL